MAISSVTMMTTLSSNRAIFEGQNCPTRGILDLSLTSLAHLWMVLQFFYHLGCPIRVTVLLSGMDLGASGSIDEVH
jgi:hypothetical protein